jgi:hypothetical protein
MARDGQGRRIHHRTRNWGSRSGEASPAYRRDGLTGSLSVGDTVGGSPSTPSPVRISVDDLVESLSSMSNGVERRVCGTWVHHQVYRGREQWWVVSTTGDVVEYNDPRDAADAIVETLSLRGYRRGRGPLRRSEDLSSLRGSMAQGLVRSVVSSPVHASTTVVTPTPPLACGIRHARTWRTPTRIPSDTDGADVTRGVVEDVQHQRGPIPHGYSEECPPCPVGASHYTHYTHDTHTHRRLCSVCGVCNARPPGSLTHTHSRTTGKTPQLLNGMGTGRSQLTFAVPSQILHKFTAGHTSNLRIGHI